MNNFNFKKIIPHLVVVVIFIGVTFGYLNPLLKGKAIKQSDIANFQGMSKEIVDYREKTGDEPLWTNSMFGGMPAYQISVLYPSNLVKYVDKALTLGLPRPADYLFLCMLGFYILMLVLKVDPWIGAVGSIAYALCSYYVISLEVGHTSKAHAIAYMAPILGSFIMAYRGKLLLGSALTALFLALQLYCNHLQITYYTMLLIGVYVVFEAVAAIKEKRVVGFAKTSAVVAAASLLAILPNTTNLLLTYDYGKYTTRGKSELTIASPAEKADSTSAQANETSGLPRDYITAWSYGVGESFTLLVPNFKGGASEQISLNNKSALKKLDKQYKDQVGGLYAYYGDQPFTAGPTYAGAIIMFMFVLGLLFVHGRFKWALFVATIVSLTFAWGSNFPALSNFIIDYLPGYNKFRSVSMTMTIANFTIPLLALLGLYKIITTPDFLSQPLTLFGKTTSLKNLHGFILAFALTGGLSLFMWLAPTSFNTFVTDGDYSQFENAKKQELAKAEMNPEIPKEQLPEYKTKLEEYFDGIANNLEEARIEIFKADAMRSGLLILGAALLLFLFFRFKFDYRILVGILGVMIIADLASVDNRFLNAKSFEAKKSVKAPFAKNEAITSALNDKTPGFRVLNLTTGNPISDASASYYLKSVGGYHGAKLKRYQQLIDFHMAYEIQRLNNLLGSRMASDSLLQALLKRSPVLNMLNTRYLIINPVAPAYANNSALGSAWFVQDYKLVANPDSEITAIGKVNPGVTAIVDKEFEANLAGFKPVFDSTGTISLKTYAPNDLVYESNCKTDQLAVFSEIYYKNGWNVFVDDKPAEYMRADFVLRAMKVPAGKHKIEFKFEPSAYKIGETVALFGSLLLFLALGGAAYAEFKRKNNTPANPETKA